MLYNVKFALFYDIPHRGILKVHYAGRLGQKGYENFDYSQWQRKSKPGQLSRPPPPARKVVKDSTLRSISDFTVAAPWKQNVRPTSAVSSVCSHSRSRIQQNTASPKEEYAVVKEKNEDLKILQLRINTREHTLKEYKKRYETLLVENIKLKAEIDETEGDANSGVKQLLRKYEKFRKGIGVLNSKFEVEEEDARADLRKTQGQIKKDLTILESQVEMAEKRLQDKQTEFHVLMNYKDKEYPVKAMRIADLQKEIDSLKITNAEDETELQHIIDTELGKLRKKTDKYQDEVTDRITGKFLDQMHPSLKDMTLQNTVMEKEIEYHTKDLKEVEAIIADLEQEVTKLLRSPKTNAKKQIFPEFFPPTQKCTPDMDVILDIPTQEWLPI
ncbi:unnamed protein product [Owenia fusiformis]|uniref:Uncharacterized protein n=1 Tax=Owenia fusiformis TaxID=6347 RepID=A0A8S4NI32_OWEFU|nr:unnamed protein product [Owenia fusiformis]